MSGRVYRCCQCFVRWWSIQIIFVSADHHKNHEKHVVNVLVWLIALRNRTKPITIVFILRYFEKKLLMILLTTALRLLQQFSKEQIEIINYSIKLIIALHQTAYNVKRKCDPRMQRHILLSSVFCVRI